MHVTYHFKIHKEDHGYWAQCIELPGCVTQGDSMKELRTNMQEALNLYLDNKKSGIVVIPN